MRFFKSCFGAHSTSTTWQNEDVREMLIAFCDSLIQHAKGAKYKDSQEDSSFYGSIKGILEQNDDQITERQLYILMQILRFKVWAMLGSGIEILWTGRLRKIKNKDENGREYYPYEASSLPDQFAKWMKTMHAKMRHMSVNVDGFIHQHKNGFNFVEFCNYFEENFENQALLRNT